MADTLSAALRERFESLSIRDQRALRIGGLVLLPVALMIGFWSLHDHLAERRAELARAAALADRASDLIAARIAAGEDLAPSGAAPLSERVTRSFERAGLLNSLVSSQAPAPDSAQLEVALRDVPFDALVAVLGRLARNEGVTIASASLVRTAPGRVDASLVLRAP